MINTELHLIYHITLKLGRHAKGVQPIQINVDKLHEIALNFTLLTRIRTPNYVIFPQDQTVTPARPAFGHSAGWLWTNNQCWTIKSNIIHVYFLKKISKFTNIPLTNLLLHVPTLPGWPPFLPFLPVNIASQGAPAAWIHDVSSHETKKIINQHINAANIQMFFVFVLCKKKMNGHAIPSHSSPKITLDSTANNALEATSPRESRGDANWSTNRSPLSTRSKVASHGRWRGAKFVLMSV